MKQEEWAERLNNHLKDYHQEPTRDLWEDIEASLDKQAKGQTRHIALRRWMMAAAIIGVLFGGAYLMWNNPYSHKWHRLRLPIMPIRKKRP